MGKWCGKKRRARGIWSGWQFRQEENEIKEAYIEQIENYGLEYDSFRSSFIDKLNPIIRKTLVCTPEKYFREAKTQSLILEDFEKENKELILEIKKLFGE